MKSCTCPSASNGKAGLESWLPLVVCLVAALVLLVMRGALPSERAYATFHAAQTLSAFPDAPLYLVLLGGADELGLPVPSIGLLLSAAGWLAAMAAVYVIGLRLKRPAMASLAAGLLALEPTLPPMLGQGALFVMGWLWCALALALAGRWPISIFLLLPLVASTTYQAYLAADVLLLAYPIVLPGLALLAGWGASGLVSLARRLPLAQADRRVLSIALVAAALAGLMYARFNLLPSTVHLSPSTFHLPLWAQAGLWLRDNTPAEAVVWSDAPGALAYFSERVITSTSPLPASTHYAPRTSAQHPSPPDYAVSVNSLAWAGRISQAWFQEHYERVHTIAHPYDSLAPLTIWRYQASPYDAGPVLGVGARFGNLAGEKIELVNYRLDSTQLVPHQARYLTLTWRALEPLAQPLSVQVRLYSEADARAWAQVDRLAPAGVKTTLWPVDRPLADRYTLPLAGDLPAGVYALAVRVYVGSEVERFVPLLDGGQELTLARLEARPGE